MPYILQSKRNQIDNEINALAHAVERGGEFTAGDFNYIVTKLMQHFVEINGKNYNNFNSLVGALDCAKMEMYRREIAPYEDEKIESNGDYK